VERVGRGAPKGLGIHAKYPAYRNFFPQAYALFGIQQNKKTKIQSKIASGDRGNRGRVIVKTLGLCLCEERWCE